MASQSVLFMITAELLYSSILCNNIFAQMTLTKAQKFYFSFLLLMDVRNVTRLYSCSASFINHRCIKNIPNKVHY